LTNGNKNYCGIGKSDDPKLAAIFGESITPPLGSKEGICRPPDAHSNLWKTYWLNPINGCYPKDAREWQKIVPEIIYRMQIEAGNELLGKEWPILKATTFLEYTRTGNRSNYEAVLFESEFILKRTEKFMNLTICRMLIIIDNKWIDENLQK
jgi:hypothetical protein